MNGIQLVTKVKNNMKKHVAFGYRQNHVEKTGFD